MKRNISLLAILTVALMAPSLSLAHDRDHDDSRFHLRAFYAGNGYSPSYYAYSHRGTSYHYSSRHKAHDLDRKAYRSYYYSNHHVQNYRHHQDRSDYKYNNRYDRDFKRNDYKDRGNGKHHHKKESDHHKSHKHHS